MEKIHLATDKFLFLADGRTEVLDKRDELYSSESYEKFQHIEQDENFRIKIVIFADKGTVADDLKDNEVVDRFSEIEFNYQKQLASDEIIKKSRELISVQKVEVVKNPLGEFTHILACTTKDETDLHKLYVKKGDVDQMYCLKQHKWIPLSLDFDKYKSFEVI